MRHALPLNETYYFVHSSRIFPRVYLHISQKSSTFAGVMNRLHVVILFLLLFACCFTSCRSWQESRAVIAMADSIDQTHHVIYDDTAALGQTIRQLDNPFGRLFMRNTLGKAPCLINDIMKPSILLFQIYQTIN